MLSSSKMTGIFFVADELSTVFAYTFLPKKPSINIEFEPVAQYFIPS